MNCFDARCISRTYMSEPCVLEHTLVLVVWVQDTSFLNARDDPMGGVSSVLRGPDSWFTWTLIPAERQDYPSWFHNECPRVEIPLSVRPELVRSHWDGPAKSPVQCHTWREGRLINDEKHNSIKVEEGKKNRKNHHYLIIWLPTFSYLMPFVSAGTSWCLQKSRGSADPPGFNDVKFFWTCHHLTRLLHQQTHHTWWRSSSSRFFCCSHSQSVASFSFSLSACTLTFLCRWSRLFISTSPPEYAGGHPGANVPLYHIPNPPWSLRISGPWTHHFSNQSADRPERSTNRQRK